ncbi:uncharacterized protein [Montipora capricornis]|uniref:uncharacterized protein isoform X1 n=2 Tax=Montipora capricornis TaxID=246305 RepID=UPI0035F1A3E7
MLCQYRLSMAQVFSMDVTDRKSPVKFLVVEVLLVIPLAHALYSGADHYWPLDEISYSRVFNWRQWSWMGTVKGDAEITWSPPRLTLDLYGDDSWVDLGSRFRSCYVDVKFCNETGLTIAFWVAFREAKAKQGLIEFGNGACGVSLIRTHDGEMNATIRSFELNKTWSVSTVNASVGKDEWHHVTLTWNFTGETHLYINGTRLDDAQTEIISNATCPDANCTCDWAMKVGTMTQPNSGIQSYSSLKLSSLVLWHYALSREHIIHISNDVRGMSFSYKGCSSYWIANLQFCYYIQPLWKKTWYEAKQLCDSYLGNLVSVGSKEEYDFLEHEFGNKEVSSCLHIGLRGHTGSSRLSWLDGNVGSFSMLNLSYNKINEMESCVYRDMDGLWYVGNCSEKCGFVCKKYRGGMFGNAEFHCRVRRHDYQLVNHRFSIHWVQNELNCAVVCLIYGSLCKSYNYNEAQNICELSESNLQTHLGNLRLSIGYQYCERV